MHYTCLEIEHHDNLATIWLTRPAVRNALNETLIAELTHAFTTLGQSITVRTLVLAGRGAAFSAGADIDWMRRMADYTPEQNLADARLTASLFHAIDTCPKAVIARVHGDAYGGGLGLIAACDIAIAVDSAQFCLSEVKLGLVPATISPYLVRAIGTRQMRRYALTAEKFNAMQAQQLGLVHEVCSINQVDQKIAQLTQHLALASPQAIARTKQLLATVHHHSIDEKLRETTAECIATARASTEGREGTDAFLSKRKPNWPTK